MRRICMWPNDRFIKLCGIELPIIQAPMAGSALSGLVVAVSEAGGLGSLACALLSVEQTRGELETIRRRTSRPINTNFFCHKTPRDGSARRTNWRRRLDAYYVQLQADDISIPTPARAPFDDKMCDLVVDFHPEIVSFHFGLRDRNLLARVRSAGAKILSTATSVDEARWLEDQGCDAIIAQGFEAGGHRGMFLTKAVSTQSAQWPWCHRWLTACNPARCQFTTGLAIARSDQDERLPPPRPERSQRNPEQLVQGSQSSPRPLRVQSEQLPTESQVLKDEVLPGTESADQPAQEMSKRHNHGKNCSGKI